MESLPAAAAGGAGAPCGTSYRDADVARAGGGCCTWRRHSSAPGNVVLYVRISQSQGPRAQLRSWSWTLTAVAWLLSDGPIASFSTPVTPSSGGVARWRGSAVMKIGGLGLGASLSSRRSTRAHHQTIILDQSRLTCESDRSAPHTTRRARHTPPACDPLSGSRPHVAVSWPQVLPGRTAALAPRRSGFRLACLSGG